MYYIQQSTIPPYSNVDEDCSKFDVYSTLMIKGIISI